MLFLLFLGSRRVILFRIVAKLAKVDYLMLAGLLLLHPKTSVFCINPLRLKTSITPYRPKAHHNRFGKDTILCRITCPIIKSLFRENTLKYVEAVEDCTITSDLQLKRKLHLGIQMLITATYSECIIINYIITPHEQAICLQVVPFP